MGEFVPHVKGNFKNKKQAASRPKNMKNKVPKLESNLNSPLSSLKGNKNGSFIIDKSDDDDKFHTKQRVNPKILLPEVNAVKSSSDSEEIRVTQKEDALGQKTKQKLNINSEIRDRNSTKNVGKNNLLPPGGSEKKVSDSSESETDTLKTVASFKSKRTCA